MTQNLRRGSKLVDGRNVFELNGKDRLMSCGAETKSETPCCCPVKCDYYEVARKLAISDGESLVSQMIELKDANTIEIDAQDLGHLLTVSSVDVFMQYGDDGINWTRTTPSPAITFLGPGAKSGVVTNISAKYARLEFVAFAPAGGAVARISAGMRLRMEPQKLILPKESILAELEPTGPGLDEDYLLLADRLSVAPGSSAILAPVSMAGRNTVQLEVTVIQTTAGLPISVDVEASNDVQTWETLRTFSGLGFGYSAPASVTSISHKYVRAKVNGPQMFGPAEVALGIKLSRT